MIANHSCSVVPQPNECQAQTATHQHLSGCASDLSATINTLPAIIMYMYGLMYAYVCVTACRLGHNTAHINVGNYRRLQRGKQEVQDAAFFDCHNKAGLEARHRALAAALDDLMAYLASDSGQVAIFDATNTTNERRQQLVSADDMVVAMKLSYAGQ